MPLVLRVVVMLVVITGGLSAVDSWQGPASGGKWSLAANWTTGLPVTGDTVSFTNESVTVDVVTPALAGITSSGAALTISSAGNLTVNGTIQAASITVSGGTLSLATVQATILPTTNGGTLNAITIPSGSLLDMSQAASGNGNNLTITTSLTVNGSVYIGNASGSLYSVLYCSGNQAWGGTGDILFGGSTNDQIDEQSGSQTLTLLNPLKVHGKSGTLSASGTLINQSSIICDVASGRLNLNCTTLANLGTISSFATGSQVDITVTTWSNSGTLQSDAQTSLSLVASGAGSNTGSLTAFGGSLTISGGAWTTTQQSGLTISDSTLTLGGTWSAPALGIVSTGTSILNLGGVFTTVQAGLISYPPSSTTVNITGVMDNSAGLALSSSTGPWYLAGGTITGGTITGGGANILVGTSNGGTLAGVTLNTTLDLSQVWGAFAYITTGLTLNGSIAIGNSSGTTYGYLYWKGGPQTWVGTGTIIAGGSTANSINEYTSGGSLTLGSQLSITGKALTITQSDILNNQALIDCNVSGGSFVLNGGFVLNNSGIIRADAVAPGSCTLSMNGLGGWNNTGSLVVGLGDALTVGLTGAGTGTNSGTITSTGGALTLTGGAWSTSGVAAVSAAGGSLTLGGAWTFPTTGDITVTGSTTLNLGGTFATPQAGLVTYPAATTTVNVTGIMDNTAGITLSALTGPWYLDGGTILGGTISGSGADTLVATTTGGTLSAVTLATTFDVSQAWGVNAIIANGLTFTGGSIALGNASASTYGYLYWKGGPQLWTGSGSIVAGGSTDNSINEYNNGETLTLGSQISIVGKSLTFSMSGILNSQGLIDCNVAGGTFLFNDGFTLNNSGIIRSDAAAPSGSTINMNTIGGWTNTGTMVVASGDSLSVNTTGTGTNSGTITSNGGALTLTGGSWSTSGVGAITANGGTLTLGGAWTFLTQGDILVTGSTALNLGGTFTTAQAGLISYPPATSPIYITGTVDNTAGITLTALTGPWYLDGGTISGGTISGSGANILIGTTNGGTLYGVTLNTVFDLTQAWGVFASISGGLTFTGGTIEIGNASGSTYGYLYWKGGPQVWSGTGTIVAGGSGDNSINQYTGGQTLTLGSQVSITGKDLTIAQSGVLNNQGLIDCNVAGGLFTFNGGFTLNNSGSIRSDAASGSSTLTMNTIGGWTNTGIMAVTAGNALSVNSTGTGINNGTITSAGGTLTLTGGSWSTAGVQAVSASGGTLNLGGNWTFPTQGDITVSGTTIINLGGMFATSQAGLITYPPATSTVNITGNMLNSGGLTLSTLTGPWYLSGGTITGGTISGSGVNTLVGTTVGGTLSGVTLDTTFDLTQVWGVYAYITNGLTFNGGTITLGNSSGSTYGYINWSGSQTWSGTGSILAGASNDNSLNEATGGQTLTISSPVLIHGQNLSISGAGTLNASGIIDCDVANGTFSIGSGLTLNNHGTIESGPSGSKCTFSVGVFTNSGIITIGQTAPQSWTCNGTFTQASGSTLNVLIGGTATALYDHFTITGAANLAGTLNITTDNGYYPHSPDSFPLLTATTLTGTMTVPGNLFGLGYTATTMTATALDGASPTVVVTAPGAMTSLNPIPFTLTFSEPVSSTSTIAANCTVGNGTVTGVTGGPLVFSAQVAPSGANVTVTLSVNAGAATNSASVGNTASNTASVAYNIAPTLVITPTTGTVVTTEPITFTITASTLVSAPTAGGLQVTGGTIGTISGTSPGTVFTVPVTVAAAGAVQFQVLAGAVTAVSNGGTNLLSAVTTVTYQPGGSVQWVGPANGDWNTGANWSPSGIPGTGAAVIIPPGSSVNLTESTNDIASVNLQGSLTLSSGATLNIGTGSQTLTLNGGTLILSGGTLESATVAAGSGGSFVATASGGTLLGVTIGLGVTFDMSQVNGAQCTVQGWTVNGTVALGASGGGTYGRINWSGTQTWNGTGNIIFGSNSSNQVIDNNGSTTTLTIASGLTIHGTGGTLYAYYNHDAIDNYGTIQADANGSLTIEAVNWVNESSPQGTFSAASGSTLTINTESGGVGSNQGLITTIGSSLVLTGTGTWSNSGTITGTTTAYSIGTSTGVATMITIPGQQFGNTISLTGGTITNTGVVTTLTTADGPWNLAGGTVSGGTIGGTIGASGPVLIGTSSGGALTGVTIASSSIFDLSLINGAYCTIYSGLTVNGTVQIGNTVGTNHGRLTWSGTQTWGGTGNIIFGSNTNNEVVDDSSIAGTLTIAQDLTIHGLGGIFYAYYNSDTIDNYGTFQVDANGALGFYACNWVNENGSPQGTFSALSGSTLTITTPASGVGSNLGLITSADSAVVFTGAGVWSNTLTGLISGTNTAYSIGTSTTPATLAFISGSVNANTISITGGTVTNTSLTTTLSSADGPWYLAGGTILGGTISGTIGASGPVLIATSSGGTLSGVTIGTGSGSSTIFDLSESGNSYCTVAVGLTVNGTIQLGATGGTNYGRITWSGTQTWSGSGNIIFGSSSSNEVVDDSSKAGTLTIAHGLVIHGLGGDFYAYYNGDTIDNYGTFQVDAFGTMLFYACNWVNESSPLGTLIALNGATLTITTPSGGAGVNEGTINCSGGLVDFTGAGTWSNPNPGTITGSNTTFNIGTPTGVGTLLTLPGQASGNTISIQTGAIITNTGLTTTLTSANGPWYLAGGTITGGTISGTIGANGPVLIGTTAGGTLTNVTIGSGSGSSTIFDLSQVGNANCTVTGGLTVNGTILLGSTNGANTGKMTWSGTQTWGGSGNIVFGGSSTNEIVDDSSVAGALTIANGLTLHGLGGYIYAYYNSDTIHNQGTIRVDPNGSLTFYGCNWVNVSNLGVFSATNGATLTIATPTGGVGSNQGLITTSNSTVDFTGGGTWSNASPGTITGTDTVYNVGTSTGAATMLDISGQTSGNTINLTAGTITNTGLTTTLAAATGPWYLDGGTILGGTISGTIGATGPVLIATGGGGTLNGVTIDVGTTFDMSQGGQVNCTTLGGLTVNGLIAMGSMVNPNYGILYWTGSQTWGGTGSILFGDSTSNRINDTLGSTTLTVGSSLTLHGMNALLRANQGGSSITNQGTIANDVPGGTFAVIAGTFTNNGILTLGQTTPQTMTCTGNFTQAGTLNLKVAALGSSSAVVVTSGTATLGGTVAISALPGYYLHATDTFTVVSATAVTGTFGSETGPFTMSYTATTAIAAAQDATAPTVAITTPSAITSTSPIPFILTFSEPVSEPSISTGFTITNGSATAITGGPIVYTVNVTPSISTQGTVTVSLNANAVTNSGGLQNAASSIVSVTYDPMPPTVTFIPSTNSYTNASPFTLTLNFTTPVSAPTTSSFLVSNGTAGTVTTVSGQSYTVPITPAAVGPVSITLLAGSVHDGSGNFNVSSTDVITYNNIAPTVLQITPNNQVVFNSAISFAITFSEAVNTLTSGNLALTGCSLVSITGSGSTWNVSVTASAPPVAVGLTVQNVTDLTGNALAPATANSASVTYATTAPTDNLTSVVSSTNQTAILYTLTSSQTVNAPVAAGFTLSTGSITNISPAGPATSYTVTVTVSSALTSPTTVSLQLKAGAVTNLNGTANSDTPSASTIYTTTPPTATISPTGTLSNLSTIPFTVTFNEAVTTPVSSGFTVTNGTISTIVAGSGNSYIVSVAVSNPAQSNTLITLQLKPNAVTDAAGNQNILSPTANVIYDITPPTATITSNGAFTNQPTIPFTVAFDKALVAAPTSAAFTVTGGTIASITAGAGNTYAITVTVSNPAVSNTAIILQLNVNGVTDLAGNKNVVTPSATVTYDITAPTALITTSGSITNQVTIPFTVTFNEAVSAPGINGFMATNGSVVSVTPISSTVSTVVVAVANGTPTNSSIILQLNVGAVDDMAGNANTAAFTGSITYDITPPTITAFTPNGGFTATAPITFQITFSEAVQAPTSANFTVTGGTLGTINSTSTTWTVSVTNPAQGSVSLTVVSATDLVGNVLVASPANTASITYSTLPPVDTLTSVAATTNQSTILYTLSSNQLVNAPVASGFTVSTGSVTGISPAGPASSYTITVTVSEIASPTTVTLQLKTGALTTLSSIPNTDSPSASTIFTTTPPTAIITASGTSTNQSSIPFTVTFDEAVGAPIANSFTVTNGSVSSVTAVSATTYTVTVAVTGGTESLSTISLQLNAGAVIDLAGNANTDTPSGSIIYDITPPVIQAFTPNGGVTGTAPISFQITFSKPVLAPISADFTVSGGTLGTLSSTSTVWTVAVTNPAQGLVSLTVTSATDLAGNTLVAIPGNTAGITFSTIPPVDTLTSVVATTNQSAILYTLTSNQLVNAPVALGFTVSAGGSVTSISPAGPAASYTVTVTVSGLTSPSTVTLQLNAGALSTLSSIPNTDSPSASTIFTTIPPTATITTIGTSTNQTSIPFTVTFDEAVVAPGISAFTATNGTVSTVTAVSATVYTVAVTVNEGTPSLSAIGLQLNAGAVVDLAGNANTVTPNAQITYDTSGPTITAFTPNGGATGSAPITFQATFSEAVLSPTIANFSLTGGTLGTITSTSTTWTVTVTNPVPGPVSLTVASATDLIGNVLAPAAANSATVTYDVPPTIVSITPNGTSTNASPIAFVVTASKALSGLVVQSNGAIQDPTGGPLVWTVMVTPSVDGAVTLTVPVGDATDLAGVTNTVAASASVTYASTAPTASVTGVATTNQSPITFTVTFSTAVTGFSAAGLTVTNGTLGSVTGGPIIYSVPVTPTANGAVTVGVLAGAASDISQTPNVASAPATVIYDTVPPFATLSVAAGLPLTVSSTTLTISFSEPVTGFSSSALSVVNATVSAFAMVNAATYTATLTPTSSSSVIVVVPASSCTDLAGNANLNAALILSVQTSAVSTTVAAPSIMVSQNGGTAYSALCPGTWTGLAQVQSFLTGKSNSQAVGYVWDAVVQNYVQVPAQQPTGGWQPDQGVFLATRQPVTFDFNGAMASLDYEIVLKPGWNFIGLPPLNDNGVELVDHNWSDLRLEDTSGNLISGTERVNLIDVGAWLWTGSNYTQLSGVLQTGFGYWIENASSPGVDLILRRLSSEEIAGTAPIVDSHHSSGTTRSVDIGYRSHGTPPPPPAGSSAASSSSNGCGLGSGIGVLAAFAFLLLKLRLSVRMRAKAS